MVSMLEKGFGDIREGKGGGTMGSQFLEQFRTAQPLAQLADCLGHFLFLGHRLSNTISITGAI